MRLNRKIISLLISILIITDSMVVVLTSASYLAAPGIDAELMGVITQLGLKYQEQFNRDKSTYRTIISALLWKKPTDFNGVDFKVVNEIATAVVRAVSEDETLADDIVACRKKDERVISDVFNAENTVLKEVSSLLMKKGGEEAEIFLNCLIIAYKVYVQKSREERGFRRRKIFRRMMGFIEPAYLMHPDNEELAGEYIYTLNHNSRSDDVEEVIEQHEARRWKRSELVTQGYFKLKKASGFFRIFKEAIEDKEFGTAMRYMDEAFKEVEKGKVILWDVIDKYENSPENSTQIPRAYAGLSAIYMLTADFYHCFVNAEECEIVAKADFERKASCDVITSLDFSMKSLEVDPDNKHSLKIHYDALNHAIYVLSQFLERQFKGRITADIFLTKSKVLKSILGLPDNKFPRKSVDLIQRIRDIHEKILYRINLYKKLNDASVGIIIELVSEDTFVSKDAFYEKLKKTLVAWGKEHVLGDEQQILFETEALIKILNFDIIDIFIIQSFVFNDKTALKIEEIRDFIQVALSDEAKEILADTQKNTINRVIGQRMGTGTYGMFGFKLVDEKDNVNSDQSDGQKNKTAAVSEKIDPTPYGWGHLRDAINNDPLRVKKLMSVLKKYSPWMNRKDIKRYAKKIKLIKSTMNEFIKDAEELLASGKKLNKVKSNLEGLKKKRAGAKSKEGYLSATKKLERTFKDYERKKIEKSIEKGSDKIQDFISQIRRYQISFAFPGLEPIVQRLTEIKGGIRDINKSGTPHYLSKSKYKQYIAAAEVEMNQIMFIRELKDTLEETLDTIDKCREIVDEFIQDEAYKDLREEMRDRVDATADEFRNASLTTGSRQEVFASKQDDALQMLEHFVDIASLVMRRDTLHAWHNLVYNEFKTNMLIYFKLPEAYEKKQDRIIRQLKVIKLKLMKLDKELLTYESISAYSEKLSAVERFVKERKDKLQKMLDSFIMEKYTMVSESLEKFERFFKRISTWFDTSICPNYKAKNLHIRKLQDACAEVRSVFMYFKSILENYQMYLQYNQTLTTKYKKAQKSFNNGLNDALTEEADLYYSKLKAEHRILVRDISFNHQFEKLRVSLLSKTKITNLSKKFAVSPLMIQTGLRVYITDTEKQKLDHVSELFNKRIEQILQETADNLEKWSNFEGDLVALPLRELSAAMYYFIIYYDQMCTDNAGFPILDPLTVLEYAYLESFKYVTQISEKGQYLMVGTRDDSIKEKGWELMKKIFLEENPGYEEKKWPEDITKRLEQYLDDFQPQVFSLVVHYSEGDEDDQIVAEGSEGYRYNWDISDIIPEACIVEDKNKQASLIVHCN